MRARVRRQRFRPARSTVSFPRRAQLRTLLPAATTRCRRAISYLVHFGFTTDRSPVASEDRVFDRVDMYGWTLGMSGKAAKLQFAAGINHRGGTSGDIHVHDLLTGQPVLTSLKTSTTAFIYSLSYEF